jgi:signal transduction histidine kinase
MRAATPAASPISTALAAQRRSTIERARLTVLLLSAAAASAILLWYIVLGLNWNRQPFLGALLTNNLTVSRGSPTGSASWNGLEAGLQPRDRIVGLAADVVTEFEDNIRTTPDLVAALNEMRRGQIVTVKFERVIDPDSFTPEAANPAMCAVSDGSSTATCYTSYALEGMPDGDLLAFFLVPVFSGTLVLAIGMGIFYFRRRQSEAFVPILICLLLAIFMAGIFDVSSTHRAQVIWLVASALLAGMIVTLALVYPIPVAFVERTPALRFLPFAVSVVIAVLLVMEYRGETALNAGASNQAAILSTIMSNAIASAIVFLYQRPRATNPFTRDQANVIFIGLLLAIVPAILWILGRTINSLGIDTLSFSIEAATPFFILPAVSVAYAVLQYRRWDTDQVISATITNGVMLLALVLGYFLLIAGASLFITDTIDTTDPLVIVFILFLVSIVFLPIRTSLSSRIDEIYFRTRRNYQEQLEKFTKDLTSLNTAPQIVAQFRSLIDDALKASKTFVFLYDPASSDYVSMAGDDVETDIRFTPDAGIIDLLRKTEATIYLEPGRPWPIELRVDRARLNILKTRVLAGIRSGDSVQGFVIISPPLSGRSSYLYEELRFINNAVTQLSLALERAQVIASLQKRARESDVLSRVAQAVNFTIDLDDLLELISAQTLSVFSSPCFYIVLREPVTNQLYYAFFLEDDDRVREHENRRWAAGRDMYSEVLRSGQPRRLTDYVRAMDQNNYQYSFENRNLKVWMGVPLIAGPTTLGVMTVADYDPNRVYTDEQLKILSDIGALAASSLDKVRLFAETTTRARQLAALNEVSRQLVAAEISVDIDNLLTMITTAAVDILNAEAGSLLLTVEDGTNDLEFKTAVGGTGQELVGKRLQAGFGLVGKVAESGRPVIVNDTSKDARFQGDISKGEFQTTSVLAVPLITRDQVIGVLEVLNKRDGTLYVNEDMELLATFAGQAAIALENARQYQSVDLQLNQRLQELEVLERIDVELNRTLDIRRVADITVRWAVERSGATAGMLGVINDKRTHLLILATNGYEADNLPPMDESGIPAWPLNSGIIRRVMRTRRADLAHDVAIDPDYVQALPGSLSQITVPMLSGDEISAVMVLEKAQEPRFSLLNLDWTQRLAEHASIAIANAQLYEELTRANESKSEFMGFAAHELKNPLASVKGYTDLMKSGMTGAISDQQRDFLGVIRTNADRMQRIIDDLRDIAAADAGQFKITLEPVNLRNVVMDTLIPFQNQFEEKRQTVINHVSEDLPLVMGDYTRLLQVMTNLVSNAHKYSPPDATITVSAAVNLNYRNRRGQPLGQVVHVRVQDTGIGMSEEDLGRIFQEDYFRSDNKLAREQKGTGLGMIITKRIIEGHNGDIWVESELGRGSVFHFAVPLAPEIVPEAEPASD